MKNIVYFDSGTTNSRAYLLDEGGALIDTAKAVIGSRDSAIAGSNCVLVDGIYALYRQLLERNGKTDADIARIYASGMISSPYGICEVRHLRMPIGVQDFAGSLVSYREERCFRREIRLIPGLCTAGEDISLVNNMRGEEIEVIGIMPELRRRFGGRPVGAIFPGSHTHTLLVRGDVMEDALACFTGELFDAICKGTILSPILSTPVEHFDADMVRLGVENLRKFGFNRALYICHAMRLFDRETPERRASYAEGVILGGLCQGIDWCCQSRWHDLRDLVIVADAKMGALYRSIFECCESPLSITLLETGKDWTPALEGMRHLLRVEKEREGMA